MRNYAQENAREKRAPHQYTADAAAWVTKTRQAYRRYQDYFSVPDEIYPKSAATRSITPDQSYARSCRNSRTDRYHGESSRFSNHRQSGA
jgi:hypothetical protein